MFSMYQLLYNCLQGIDFERIVQENTIKACKSDTVNYFSYSEIYM